MLSKGFEPVFKGLLKGLINHPAPRIRSGAQTYLRLKLGIRFFQKMKNRRFWTQLAVSRFFQLAIYTVWHAEFESAV